MIKELRKEIDNIDENLVDLLGKRKGLIKEIASIKKSQNKPIIDQKREQELIIRLKKLSKEKNIDENLIVSLYKIILENSRNEQEK
jgi:chorismate mutase